MLQQPEQFRAPLAVRDGQRAPVTCLACGCRLERDATAMDAWRHFGALGGRDARGCRPACVDLAHDERGRAAITA